MKQSKYKWWNKPLRIPIWFAIAWNLSLLLYNSLSTLIYGSLAIWGIRWLVNNHADKKYGKEN